MMKAADIALLARDRGVLEAEQPRVVNASRRDLARWFRDWGCDRGAEIGVWTGQFSEELCAANPDLSLTAVDPWRADPDYRDRKNDALRLEAAYGEAQMRLNGYRCQLWRMKSLEAARLVPDRSLDFVYIDGNHGRPFVDADLETWYPKVRRGGVVAGHDYELVRRSSWIEVKDAVDAFIASRHIRPVFILAADKSPSFMFWVS